MTGKGSIGALLCAALTTGATATFADGILGLENPADIADARAAYLSISAFAGSDFAPIHEIRANLSEGYAPRSGRNLAIAGARAASGVEWQGFRLGVVHRREWLAEANKDTLDLYRTEHLGLNHAIGRSYAIDYRLRGFEAAGIQLGKAYRHTLGDSWTVAWGANASLLHGEKMRSESWSGSAVATTARTVTMTGDVTRRFSGLNTEANSFIPAFRAGDPRGNGYSIDLGLRLEQQDGSRFEWTIGDALSNLRWTDIPEMTLTGTSAYNGTFPGGRKWRIALDESLPVKHVMQWSMPLAQTEFSFSDSLLRGHHFPVLGARKEFWPGWNAKADYDIRFRSLGFGVDHGILHVGLRSGSLSLARANAFGISTGIKLDF